MRGTAPANNVITPDGITGDMTDPVYETIQRAKRQAESGNPSGAAETLEAYLSTDPHNTEARIFLANVLDLHLKDKETARMQLDIVLDLDPDNEKALKAMAVLLQGHKRNTETVDGIYRRLLETCPDPDLYASYAFFLKMQKGDFARAAEYYEKAIALAPRRPEYRRNYAVLLLNDLKDWQKARSELEALMGLVPGDEKVRKAYERLIKQKFDKSGNVKKGLFGRPRR